MNVTDVKVVNYKLTGMTAGDNAGLYSSMASDIKCGSKPTVTYSGFEYTLSKVNESSLEFISESSDNNLLIVNSDNSVSLERMPYILGDAVEIQQPDDSPNVKIVHASDLIRGRVGSDGKWVDHITQVMTPNFIPVKKGDHLIYSYKSPNGGIVSKISLYNANKEYQSTTDWSLSNLNGGGGNDYVFQSDGFIKLTMTKSGQATITSRSQLEVYDSAVVIARFGVARYWDGPFYEKMQGITGTDAKLVLTKSMLEQGYINYTDNDGYVKSSSPKRVRTFMRLKVRVGDIIAVTDISYLITASIQSEEGTKIMDSPSARNAIVVSKDGYAYVTIRRSDDANFTPSEAANKVILYRVEENRANVFVSDKNCLRLGAFNSSGEISSHSSRIVNYKPILANKGDILICNSPYLMMNVWEMDLTTQTNLYALGSYFSTVHKANPDTKCTYYKVKNDNAFLNCMLAPIYQHTLGPLSDYYDCIMLLRTSKNDYKFERLNKNTPSSSRKGRVIPSDLYTMQDGSFVGDKLWVSVDSYSSEPGSIKVIDPSDGTIERTISHDFGHNGVADYCEETDTLLNVIPGDDIIYLLPNASEVTTAIAKSDCIQIDVNTLFEIPGSGLCGCFGENKQTLYLCKGVESNGQEGYTTKNKIYKLWLEMADGEYTGNAELLGTYSYGDGEVAGLDADYGSGEINSTQSCKYDGFLYLAYGTTGHNFFLVDLDDKLMEWHISGRIAYEYFTADHTKKYLEPEFVALKGDKIVCGSRNYNDQISSIVEFQRGF